MMMNGKTRKYDNFQHQRNVLERNIQRGKKRLKNDDKKKIWKTNLTRREQKITMKTRQVDDETNFYILSQYSIDIFQCVCFFFANQFFMVTFQNVFFSVFPSQKWIRAINGVIFRGHFEYLIQKGIGPLHQAFDKMKIHFCYSKTHKFNWIQIYMITFQLIQCVELDIDSNVYFSRSLSLCFIHTISHQYFRWNLCE